MRKKAFIAALAAACVLSLSAPGLAAPADIFADVPAKHWSYEAVQKLAKEGIVSGDAGRFNGDRTITRYEMAVMVANAMTKLEKADAQQKALIEKLAKEYQDDLRKLGADLTKLGARVAKVEQKAKVNFFFDNRLEYTHTSLSPADNGQWVGGTGKIDQKDQFMERIRVYMNVPVGDQWEWNSRLVQAKWNFNSPNPENVRFDRFWLTGKNIFGKDSGMVEIGKMMLYPGKGTFYGNTGDTEGIYYTKSFDKLTMRLGNARAVATAGQPAQDVSFVEATYRPTKTSDITLYTIKQDASSALRDMDLQAVAGAFEIPGTKGLALSFEWAKNTVDTAGYKDKKGYAVALQSKYKATNYMPHLYTNMVNPFVKGDKGWAISYRHLPAGVAGLLNRGAFNWVPLTTDNDGTWQNTFNDVNAWRFDYIYVPWKNVQWTFTYDRVEPINGSWTNHSIQSTFNFFF